MLTKNSMVTTVMIFFNFIKFIFISVGRKYVLKSLKICLLEDFNNFKSFLFKTLSVAKVGIL